MKIDFPVGRQIREMMGIAFLAIVDGKNVRCLISDEALQDRFGAERDLISAFEANRRTIELKAIELIEAGLYHADGSVILKTHDFS